MLFEIDIERRLGEAEVRTRISSESGLTALFGPSGAGKSSILNMVAGLLRPDRGTISIGGRLLFDSGSGGGSGEGSGIDIPPEHRRAGYVFQDARLFPHLRVHANLLYGWKLAPPEARRMTLEEVIEFLGIAHLLDRWPRTLSGGEAQRVAIGRALLSGPAFLLMDEPLASLDLSRREEIMHVIERLRDELHLPILYVSHDLSEVDRLAGRIVRLEANG